MDDEKTKDTRQPELQTGEKGFTVFLLLVGLFFTWQSWKLYCNAPGASSYGAVPLACSVMITVFALAILLTNLKKHTPLHGLALGQKLKTAFRTILPGDVLVIVGLGVAYCLALYLDAGFMIATPIFLWCTMSFLSRGKFVKNLLWTALCMLFIYLVFRVLFSVVLP
jgi:hypothetical protein